MRKSPVKSVFSSLFTAPQRKVSSPLLLGYTPSSSSSSGKSMPNVSVNEDRLYRGIQDFEKKCSIPKLIPEYISFTEDDLKDKDSFNKKYKKAMLKIHPDRLSGLTLSDDQKQCISDFSSYLNNGRDEKGWSWRGTKTRKASKKRSRKSVKKSVRDPRKISIEEIILERMMGLF
jgi:hypothetical protein